MAEGWIQVHRKLFDNGLLNRKPYCPMAAWIFMIAMANHKDGFIDVRGNLVPVKRGQLGWSVEKLSLKFGWSRGKLNRFLKHLETVQQIEQHKSFVTSVITITNYDEYQTNGQQTGKQTDSRRTADGQQTDTNNNDNNVNNENNDKKERGKRKRFTPPTPQEVEAYAKAISFVIDAEYFCSSYESKGWMVGKNHMRDWKAAVRTWKQRDQKPDPYNKAVQGITRSMTDEEFAEYQRSIGND